MSYSRSPYRQAPARGGATSARSYGRNQASAKQQTQYSGGAGSRSRSPFQPPEEQPPQTFVFSELPGDEKDRFMDFLLNNDVEFQFDQTDNTYVATIKIVNKPDDE